MILHGMGFLISHVNRTSDHRIRISSVQRSGCGSMGGLLIFVLFFFAALLPAYPLGEAIPVCLR